MHKHLVDYRNLVMRLLPQGKYPILSNFVILEIYYKNFETKELGKQYDVRNNMPETVYEQINDPYDIIFFTKNGRYFNSHKENIFNLNFRHLPLNCKKIKIYKNDAISKLFKKDLEITFEEELYLFITCLNYDIPKIKELLNLDFIQSTTFIPLSLKMNVCEYTTKDMEGTYEMPDCFGPNNNDLQVRLFEGQLSNCFSKTNIVSLRDHHAFESYLRKESHPNFINLYNFYNIHYASEQKSFIPLAYNPLENPIIN